MSEAQDAPLCIKDGMVSLSVDTPDGALEISRVPDADHRLTDEWAHTSRPAPPALLQPLVPVAGVVPLGELELIEALSAPDIVVADGRKRDQYAKYTIPGAVNLPFTDTDQALEHLGCRRGADGWDCRDAARVALFCNGAWCGQSPTAIRKMVEAGFPAERILYYRNGLQGWLLQGLSVWTPGKAESFYLQIESLVADFASRLMPFVSFDMVSYAAGLSRLHAWRFAFATLAGIIPASFLLAHFGGEAVSGDVGRATWAVLGLGLATGLPLLWVALRQKPEKENP